MSSGWYILKVCIWQIEKKNHTGFKGVAPNFQECVQDNQYMISIWWELFAETMKQQCHK